MPSPFPGMNPYLEQSYTWNEFHTDFMVRARDALARQVGPKYVVKVEVQLLFHDIPVDERDFLSIADVGVSAIRETPSSGPGTAILEAPVQLRLPDFERVRQRRLEIHDRRDRRVITIVELLSPSNKTPGEDRDAYLAKRRQILAEQVHFVEIDLRRGGRRPNPPDLPACDYYALVSRREDRPLIGVWPIGLREPFPVIPIPLEAPDPEVRLDLKAVLDQAYDAADYAKYIYQETPEPPLSTEEAEWARQFIPPAA